MFKNIYNFVISLFEKDSIEELEKDVPCMEDFCLSYYSYDVNMIQIVKK